MAPGGVRDSRAADRRERAGPAAEDGLGCVVGALGRRGSEATARRVRAAFFNGQGENAAAPPPPGVRRSPRLEVASTAPRRGLADITNVAAGRAAAVAGERPGVKPQQGLEEKADRLGADTARLQETAAKCRPKAATVAPTASAGQLAPPARGGAATGSRQRPPVASIAAAGAAEAEVEDIQAAAEYAAEIGEHLRVGEGLFLPRADYMESQQDINARMRAILVDWLVEVHMKYKLRGETLFLAVNLIDRYLSQVATPRKKLQLVGVGALLVAAKFEEIHPPEVNDFVYITDNAYTKDEILSMECAMLNALSFQVACPTVVHFLERIARANRCDVRHRHLVQYIAELALLDMRMLRYPPSHLAAAAVLLSNELLQTPLAWPAAVAQQAQHSEQAIRGCADELRGSLEGAVTSSLKALRKKFSAPERSSVSRLAQS